MNKIRTSTQASDLLDREFAWRLKEIANLKSSIRTAESIIRKTLLRAGVPLLYAHWEGFVKNAAEIYLNYVANQRHTYNELKSCFVVHGVKAKLNLLIDAQKAELNTSIVDFLLDELNERASIPYKDIINTQSNLNSSVFKSIAYSIGIDPSAYATKYIFIDKSVLGRRNSIAHGEYLDLNIDDYNKLSDGIISLLRQFKTDVENALTFNAYKRSV